MDDVCLIHYDLVKLQEILDVANHIAKKYHIEFGAAKCKVVRIGRGPKSQLILNGETLEETDNYKYLGEIFNNKGDLADHIKSIEGKIHAVTQKIMNTTGNKEFKGMRMQAIWQLVEATIIPIITYGSEGWEMKKREQDQLQTILNKALKTILYLPQSMPTAILLAETGFPPVKCIVNKKRIMQAHRIENMKDAPLIKQITRGENSTWNMETRKLMSEIKINPTLLLTSKINMKKTTDAAVQEARKKEIENEAQAKSKIKDWYNLKSKQKIWTRPEYMNKLSRKQCHAIIMTRGRMLPLKTNRKDNTQITTCRWCGKEDETQRHILKECELNPEKLPPDIEYEDIYNDEDIEKLRKIADHISGIINKIEET